MPTDDNITAFRRVIDEVFSQGNVTVLDQLMTPNFIDHEAPPGQSNGVDGTKALVAMMRTAFPDLRVTIEDIAAINDQVWARVMFRGTNTGPYMNIPPTGRTIAVQDLDLVRYEGGKLAEHWGVLDRLGMMEQLGLIPTPELAPATAANISRSTEH